MAKLNITLNGLSADYKGEIDADLSDRELKQLAVEVVRSGDVPGLWIANLPENTFQHFVVDRFRGGRGERRIYLRPKVPFGASSTPSARKRASSAT